MVDHFFFYFFLQIGKAFLFFLILHVKKEKKNTLRADCLLIYLFIYFFCDLHIKKEKEKENLFEMFEISEYNLK